MSSTPTPTPSAQPQRHITDTDKSALIEILTWLFLSFSAVALGARSGTKLILVRSLKWDDHLALLSMAASIAQTIAVLFQCSNGWGTHMDTLDPDQLSAVFKFGYAADVLFVVSLALAKLSFCISILTVTQPKLRPIVWGIGATILLWAISGFFVILFQCKLPSPWEYVGQTCIDRSAFWTYFNAVNILTDIASLAVIFEAVRHIQTNWSKRLVVLIAFASRIFVIPAVVAQIYFSQAALRSDDPTFDMWETTIVIQLVQCLSIFTTCIQVLKPLLDALESGGMRADHFRRQGKSGYGYNSGQDKYGSNAQSGGRYGSQKNTSNMGPAVSVTQSHHSEVHEMVDMRQKRSQAGGTTTVTHEPGKSWDGQSHTSQKGLIQQTKTWEVEVERRASVTSSR